MDDDNAQLIGEMNFVIPTIIDQQAVTNTAFAATAQQTTSRKTFLVHDVRQVLIQDAVHVLNRDEIQFDLTLLCIHFLPGKSESSGTGCASILSYPSTYLASYQFCCSFLFFPLHSFSFLCLV